MTDCKNCTSWAKKKYLVEIESMDKYTKQNFNMWFYSTTVQLSNAQDSIAHSNDKLWSCKNRRWD